MHRQPSSSEGRQIGSRLTLSAGSSYRNRKETSHMALAQIAKDVAADPYEAGLRLWGKFREQSERRKPRCPYASDPLWELKLHMALGAGLPCAEASGIGPIWPDVLRRLTDRGINPGPASYSGHNDGDPAF